MIAALHFVSRSVRKAAYELLSAVDGEPFWQRRCEGAELQALHQTEQVGINGHWILP